MRKGTNVIMCALLVTILTVSCLKARNDKKAFFIVRNNQTFIRLTGKRVPLTHDPISAFTSSLIDDSLLIPISNVEDALIKGEEIPVPIGDYKYQGNILIANNILKVNLKIVNTDDNKIVPDIWNGTYELIRN